jgi:Acetyltransferases, including N-acetylases of ribosomal proteins
MLIETDRLIITEFDETMIESVHLNSLDDDNRKFVPDEVFETLEVARDTVLYLIECYKTADAPKVHPIIQKSGGNIGYVQAVPFEDGWEIGYHIAKQYTKRGYATEAVKAFLPVIMNDLGINKIIGICLIENAASRAVMEKCGFTLTHKGTGNYQGNEREICRFVYTT